MATSTEEGTSAAEETARFRIPFIPRAKNAQQSKHLRKAPPLRCCFHHSNQVFHHISCVGSVTSGFVARVAIFENLASVTSPQSSTCHCYGQYGPHLAIGHGMYLTCVRLTGRIWGAIHLMYLGKFISLLHDSRPKHLRNSVLTVDYCSW